MPEVRPMNDNELDLAVAKHVFGETFLRCKLGIPMDAHLNGGCDNCLSFSTTGDGMLSVIERMQTKDWLVSVTKGLCGRTVDEEQMQFEAEFRQRVAPWGVVETYDPSAPRAVAIAALRALGVEV